MVADKEDAPVFHFVAMNFFNDKYKMPFSGRYVFCRPRPAVISFTLSHARFAGVPSLTFSAVAIQ